MRPFAGLSDLGRSVDRWVTRITLACAWFTISALIAVTSLDVAIRQIAHIGSDKLKEIESSLFLALVMTSIGYTYLRDGHVRIDIVRERLSLRTRAWVELAGCVAILMPVCAILIYYGLDSTLTSFLGGERPEAFAALPIQWVVKATVPVGYLLLLLAAICVAARNLLFLCGRETDPAPRGEPLTREGHPPEEGGDR